MQEKWFERVLITAAIIGVVALVFANIVYAAGTVCQIGNGCTGTSTSPSYGQLLVGNSSGGYNLTATSSLGISGGGSSASSTLLADNNSWTGIDNFSNASSNFAGTWQTFSPSHFQTAGTYLTAFGNYASTTGAAISISTSTETTNGVTQGMTIAISPNGILFTPTISGTLSNAGLAHSTITLNSQTLTLGDTNDTITAASSSLLANNNTFSGNNTFSASTTFSKIVNLFSASTSQFTASGWTWLTGLPSGSGNGSLCETTAGQVEYFANSNCVASAISTLLQTLTAGNDAGGLAIADAGAITGTTLSATSTTGTSTVTNAFQVGTVARSDMVSVTDTATSGASVTTGGVANITGVDGATVVIHKTGDAVDTGRTLVINQDSTTDDQDMILASSSGSNVTALDIKGYPTGKGIIKCEHDGGGTGFFNGSCLSINTAGDDAQGIFIQTGTGIPINVQSSGSATLFKLDNIGNSTTTGYTEVDGTGTSTYAGGLQVAHTLNVQSSSASSTFGNGINLTAGCFSIGNVCVGGSGGGSGGTGVATTSLLTLAPITEAVTTASITFGFSGLATTSQPTDGQLLESNGGLGVFGASTTTVTCAGTASCTTFNILGSSPITLTGTGLTSYDPFTHPAAGQSATTSLMLLNGQASTTQLSVFTKSYFGATATSTFNNVGTLTLQDADNAWSGIATPTRYLTFSFATTTTMAGTSSAAYDPSAVASFAGTLKTAQCSATTSASFINIALYIGTTQVLPDFVASGTVGTITFSSNNTFTAGQNISLLYGSSTASANNVGANCTLSATQSS